MTPSRSERLLGFIGAVALACAISSWLGGPAPAFAQQAGGGELFAVTAPGQGQGSNVLFVLDPTEGKLLVYEHRSGGGPGALKLTAVRSLEQERQLLEWPSPKAKVQVPSVEEMHEALEKEGKKRSKPK